MSMVSGYCAPALLSVTSVPRHSSCWLWSQRLHIPAYVGIGSQKNPALTILPTPAPELCLPIPLLRGHRFHSVAKNPHSLSPTQPSFFATKVQEQLPPYPPSSPPLPPTYHSSYLPSLSLHATTYIIPHTGIIP